MSQNRTLGQCLPHGSHTANKSHGNKTHARAAVEQSVSSEVEEDLFHAFNISDESDTDCFDLTVNDITIHMLPDSGAQVNLLPKELYDKNCKHLPKLQPCVRSVFPYMSSKSLDTCGESYSDIYEPVSKKCIHCRIVVVEGKGIPLLCKNDSIELGLIQIDSYAPVAHAVQTDSGKLCDRLKRVHPEVFLDQPGKLNDRQWSLHIDSHAPGVIQRINRVPFNWRDKVKAELGKRMEWYIIERLDMSEWVSPLRVVKKRKQFVSVSI